MANVDIKETAARLSKINFLTEQEEVNERLAALTLEQLKELGNTLRITQVEGKGKVDNWLSNNEITIIGNADFIKEQHPDNRARAKALLIIEAALFKQDLFKTTETLTTFNLPTIAGQLYPNTLNEPKPEEPKSTKGTSTKKGILKKTIEPKIEPKKPTKSRLPTTGDIRSVASAMGSKIQSTASDFVGNVNARIPTNVKNKISAMKSKASEVINANKKLITDVAICVAAVGVVAYQYSNKAAPEPELGPELGPYVFRGPYSGPNYQAPQVFTSPATSTVTPNDFGNVGAYWFPEPNAYAALKIGAQMLIGLTGLKKAYQYVTAHYTTKTTEVGEISHLFDESEKSAEKTATDTTSSMKSKTSDWVSSTKETLKAAGTAAGKAATDTVSSMKSKTSDWVSSTKETLKAAGTAAGKAATDTVSSMKSKVSDLASSANKKLITKFKKDKTIKPEANVNPEVAIQEIIDKARSEACAGYSQDLDLLLEMSHAQQDQVVTRVDNYEKTKIFAHYVDEAAQKIKETAHDMLDGKPINGAKLVELLNEDAKGLKKIDPAAQESAIIRFKKWASNLLNKLGAWFRDNWLVTKILGKSERVLAKEDHKLRNRLTLFKEKPGLGQSNLEELMKAAEVINAKLEPKESGVMQVKPEHARPEQKKVEEIDEVMPEEDNDETHPSGPRK